MKTSLKIAQNNKGLFGFTVESGQFKIDFDVPEMMKGENSAPNPHIYFDASLLACKAITAKMYAMRKQYPLEDVLIDMEVDSSREREGKYIVNLEVALVGDLSETQRLEIHHAMLHCPIHKLISDEVNVEVNSTLK